MIDRDRVDSGLNIGEVLQKKISHVRVNLTTIWHRQIGVRLVPRFLALLAPRCLGESAQG